MELFVFCAQITDQLFATLQKWIKPVAERAIVRKPQLLDASCEPDQALPDEAQLPKSLPGFDFSAGLKRLRGNKRLYKKLLLDFGSQYTGVAGEISNALAAGDFEQAHSLVHNLKGLAGNLAATDLQAATVEMEKRVKGNQAKSSTAGQLSQKFTELEKAINEALKAVQALGPSTEETACEISEEMIAEVPSELIKGACSRIKQAVDTGDVMGVKSIAEALKAQSDAITPISDKFIQLAEDFDFDGILKFVGELSSESNH